MYQASYVGPDEARHVALMTFETKDRAEDWLSAERLLMAGEGWTPPKLRRKTALAKRPSSFGLYSEIWLQNRRLKPRTVSHYKSLLDHQLKDWSTVAVKDIRPEMVRDWYGHLDQKRPTLRAHAYGLLRAILATAVEDGLLVANPCHIRGAGSAKRVHKVKPATLAELEILVNSMPEPYKMMTLLAGWCALRFGELVELRRKDIDLANGVIHIRRGAVRVDGEVLIGTPKSESGIRDVAIPPHLLPGLKSHMSRNITGGKEGLLFPNIEGGTLSPTSLYGKAPYVDVEGRTHAGWGFYKARVDAGRPDLRWHDLRHTGAVLAASTGATLAELMGRLGHSTPGAALRYQHAAEGRDQIIANALSALAEK